jgi:hypothetical protein
MENYQNDAQAVEAFGEKYKKLTTEVGKVTTVLGGTTLVTPFSVLYLAKVAASEESVTVMSSGAVPGPV